MKTDNLNGRPKVVIVGGGFGGLYAAKGLANKGVSVTLVDRKNHHTFQPLLYQVATSVLSPGEIATPLRHVLFKAKNVEVILGEVTSLDTKTRKVLLDGGGELEFDYLVVAAGARHSYFGHDEWERDAPGLKTVEDATEIRRRILQAFEAAEREAHLTGAYPPLHFAIIGGGPTGVELAGAIADIARRAMSQDFRLIDPTRARISIFEGSPRVLGMYTERLSDSAKRQLEELGVEVNTASRVTAVEQGRIKVGEEWIPTTVTLWATGVAASPLGRMLSAETDRAGRVPVQPDLSIRDDKNVFVIGDMALLTDASGKPVPGLAAAAQQEGRATAANILRDVRGAARVPFSYWDKGSMATIGRNRAVAQVGRLGFSGYVARMMWAFVHVALLGGGRSRLMVLREWLWARYTRERSARLITGNTYGR
ncbi:MAG: NAD(P)/FAD-dependent oxidoreductase [Acidobacteria bacterium]|nr:NAD(P)/FAD-dependent oxidoreductase [Acidobacteriota bacterium]